MRPDLARELRLAVAAVQFLTRLPTPQVPFDPDWLARGAKYFPLAGLLVGALGAAVLALAGRVWPAPVPALLAIAVTLWVTGALHEDGLADAADGLGGATRERRLAIMKDSRIGAFGVLALLLALALQVGALGAMPPAIAASAFAAAHAGGRLAAVIVMGTTGYAGDVAQARIDRRSSGDRPSAGEMTIAAAFGLAPVLALGSMISPARAAAALLLGAGLAGCGGWRLCRALGGHTGDVLGAVVVLFQVGFLLGASLGSAP